MRCAAFVGLFFGLILPVAAPAQERPAAGPPVVDTIVIVTHNVFGPEEARSSILFRAANSLHVTTRTSVVRRELLFSAGQPYDSSLVAETERNLRRLGIFRDVTIDTTRMDSRMAVVVKTGDGWTTQINVSARSTGGTFTWAAGLAERNFLGTATRAGASYRQDPDRTATTLRVGMDRVVGSDVAVSAVYDDLSDGVRGGASVGIPWRATTDRQSFQLSAAAGRERILRYRNGTLSEQFRRLSVRQTTRFARAISASSAGYVRVGIVGQILRAEHISYADTGLTVPDSVRGMVGLFGEASRARYRVVTHYNGFARDVDVDLSSRVSVAAWFAPATFGYEETGVGAAVGFQTGVSLGRGFAAFGAKANALFTPAGADSGQAWAGLTVAALPFPRNATVLHVEAGAQRGIAPGAEFDIGHGRGPRAFGPHSFTGTRMVWGSLEHRAFVLDEVFGLLGVGFAAFVDYGGAWFEDQSPRLGGDLGLGLRLGATRATGNNVGRIDLAHKFGDGFAGNRWVLSFGRGFAF